jgi:hypothetical protein
MNDPTAQVGEIVRTTAAPLAVSGLSLAGVTLNEWVYICTIIYTLFQIVRVLPKAVRCGKCFWQHGACIKDKDGHHGC